MEITYEIVIELLHYNPDTGQLTFLARDRKWFNTDKVWKMWNTRFAGKPALTNKDTCGYLGGRLLGTNCLSHRIIWLWMTGILPDQIDHENGIRTDNRWQNLRNLSSQGNNKNRKRPINNTSGVMGVAWDKQFGKWVAYITVNGFKKKLGKFKEFKNAVGARKDAERLHNYHVNHGR